MNFLLGPTCPTCRIRKLAAGKTQCDTCSVDQPTDYGAEDFDFYSPFPALNTYGTSRSGNLLSTAAAPVSPPPPLSNRRQPLLTGTCASLGCTTPVGIDPFARKQAPVYCNIHSSFGWTSLSDGTCQLSGCTKPVYTDPKTGKKYQHCGRTHARAARANGGLVQPSISLVQSPISPVSSGFQGAGERANPLGRLALVICDMQENYRRTVHQFSSVLATILRMISFAELFGIQVFTTSIRPAMYGSVIPEVTNAISPLPQKALLGGSFVKMESFGSSQQLTDTLDWGGFSHVLLCGVEAHIAIESQARALATNGVTVHVIADGISSCNKEEIPLSLDRIRRPAQNSDISIATSESIAFYIMDVLEPTLQGDEKQQLCDRFLAMVIANRQVIASGLRNLLGESHSASMPDDSEAIE